MSERSRAKQRELVDPESLPVLLITTAVRAAPSVNVRIRDAASRLELTLEGLGEWLDRHPDLRIVVCDGSNVDLTPVIREKWPTANVEVLHFQNDEKKVARLGKGFGEGQIIAFALKKSRLLRGAPVFMKCTGKLWLENLGEALASLPTPNGFMIRQRPGDDGAMAPFWIDTRFFVVETRFFRKHLASAFRDVDRPAHRYIEHVYCERLMKTSTPERLRFRIKPQIRGVSGSTGKRW
jgi:hypothetical protein